MTSPAFTQVTFRGRNDDGSESGATWKDVQGNDWTQDTGVNFRVRFRIDETNSRAWTSKNWNLYYQINSGGYSAVTGSTPVQFSLSSNFADGDDCLERLTGGTGTFVSDNNGMKETTGGATNSGTAGYLFEVEFCLKLDGAQLATNDTINLRIYDGSSTIAAYTDTPVITVNVTSQNINETATLAVTNKVITALEKISVVDTTTLTISDGIGTLSEVQVQDANSLTKSKAITALSEVQVQDANSLSKYKNITIDVFQTIEETLYGN